MEKDLAFYEQMLAEVTHVLETEPGMSEEFRQMLKNSREYCRKQIALLKYYEFRRGIIASN